MSKLRRGKVRYKDTVAGVVEETQEGYRFAYDAEFLDSGSSIAVSLPIRREPYDSGELFPFFKGLLPEGWYREIVCRTLKIDEEDEFGLLIRTCGDCIGAVSVEEE